MIDMILKFLNTFLKNIKNKFIYSDNDNFNYLRTSEKLPQLINSFINFLKIIHLKFVIFIFFFRTKQPKESESCFFYLVDNNLKNFALHLPLFKFLILKKWSIILLDNHFFSFPSVNDTNLKNFSSVLKKNINKYFSLKKEKNSNKLFFDWKINHEKRIAIANNINFYGTILNFLSKSRGEYYPSIVDEEIKGHFNQLLISLDNSLKVCLDISKINNIQKYKKVIFSGFEHNYPPTSAFKLFCYKFGREKNINFTSLLGSYRANIDKNNEIVSSVVFSNFSKDYINTRFPLKRDLFDKWLNEKELKKKFNIKYSENFIKETGLKINYKNNIKKINKNSASEIEFIKKTKRDKNLKKIACLFGHVPYDITIDLDEGYCFKDMKDWVNKTINIVKNTDILLLIKPHPHEVHKIHSFLIKKSFLNLIENTNNNVLILNSIKSSNIINDELFKLIDLSITWRNVTAIESLSNGIPTIACAKYPVTECLDFNVPKNLDSYKKMIFQQKTPNEYDKKRANLFFEYYNQQMLDYNLGMIPHRRNTHGDPHLKLKLLNKFQNHESIIKMYKKL